MILTEKRMDDDFRFPHKRAVVRALYADFLSRVSPQAKINRSPEPVYPLDGTEPLQAHVSIRLPRAYRTIYISVTPEWYFPDMDITYKGSLLPTIRLMARLAKEREDFGGIGLHQQHLIDPRGYALSRQLIQDISYERITTEQAQDQLFKFATDLPLAFRQHSNNIRWLEVEDRLREFIG